MSLDARERDTLQRILALAGSLDGSTNTIVRDFARTVSVESRATLVHVAAGADGHAPATAGETDGGEAAAAYPCDRYSAHVPLSCTDAFEVLYWGAPTVWAQTGYENLMRSVGHPIEEMLPQDWDIPVVRTEIEYSVPLRLGDPIDVETSVVEVGNRSLRIESRILLRGALAVRVARVHVATKRKGGPAVLPGWLRALGPAREDRGPRA